MNIVINYEKCTSTEIFTGRPGDPGTHTFLSFIGLFIYLLTGFITLLQ